jgi:hypothetical protein
MTDELLDRLDAFLIGKGTTPKPKKAKQAIQKQAEPKWQDVVKSSITVRTNEMSGLEFVCITPEQFYKLVKAYYPEDPEYFHKTLNLVAKATGNEIFKISLVDNDGLTIAEKDFRNLMDGALGKGE